MASVGWRERFRAERVVWFQLAAGRPERGLVATNRTGPVQLHAWDLRTGELRRLTDRPEGTTFGFLGGDGRHVYYLDDREGNEVGHYVRVPWDGGPAEDVTPARPPYSSFGGGVDRRGTRLALSLADADGSALVAVDLAPDGGIGKARDLHRSAGLLMWPVLSPDGDLVVIGSNERSGSRHCGLMCVDGRTGERVAELWGGPEADMQPGPFAPAGTRVAGRAGTWLAGSTDRTGHRRPVCWDPATGERFEVSAADVAGDVEPMGWSSDGTRLLLMQTHRAADALWIHELATGETRPLRSAGGSHGPGIAFGPGGEVVTTWQDAANPPRVEELDPATGSRRRTLVPAGPVPPGRPLRSVAFVSSDGQAVQAWVGVPDGTGPFPAILHTHGGPEDVATDAFAPEAQAWLDRGFAYLTVNYRGSLTFGSRFQQQIWGNPGQWELEDVIAAHRWLVGEGIARPDAVVKTGASYGGYLTLLALGRRPELWAGGMAVVPIADWATMYADSADIMKAYCAAFMGGTPAEVPDRYAAASPIRDAESVRAPLLILQERHDARTPARQVEVYARRLRDLGKDVELEWFEGGHASAYGDPERRIGMLERQLTFAERVVGR